ncbi:MAG: ABC transporter substrate-binding protein [Christensenellaceae bacterium]
MINTKNIMKSVKNIVAVLLCCMMLTGCGGMMKETEKSSAAPTATQEMTAQEGGELFIAMPAEVESFDPITAKNEDLINLLTLIYETPLKITADGKIEPNLMSEWKADQDGRVFTFTLRDGVVFSDGTPLSIDDVIASAQKVWALDGTSIMVTDANAPVEPQTSTEPSAQPSASQSPSPSPSASPSASASASTDPNASADISKPKKVEMPERNRYAQYNTLIESVQKVDDKTMTLTMKEKGNAALYFMMFPVMKQTKSTLPIGTGPYKAESYDTQMTLTVNESWWKKAPHIKKIVAKPMTSEEEKIMAVDTSILDFVTTSELYASKYKVAGKLQVKDYMTNYYDCIVPNLMTESLKEVGVRQAISYAIDRREIIATVLLNHAVPTNLPIAPDFFAYDARYKIDDDLKIAKQLLNEAGYKSEKDGEGTTLALKLMVSDERDMAYRKEAAKAIKKQLAKVGIEITIEELPQADYYERLNSGQFELAFCSFYMDPNPNLSFLFDVGAEANYGHVQSEEITAAIAACNASVTQEEEIASYAALQKTLTERVPQIGLYFKMNSIICDETIKEIKAPRQNEVFATIGDWYIYNQY